MTTANLSIFVQDYAPRTTRVVQTPDGSAQVYSALAIGRIEGRSRTIPALVCEEVGEEDRWYLVNLYAGSKYFDTVAVLGATSGAQAEEWARRQVLAYQAAGENGSDCCGGDVTASADALQEYLDSAAAGVSILPIRQPDIGAFEGKITDRPVVWEQEWLKSHSAADLLHELARRDRDGQMMDAMCKDDLPKVVEQMDGIIVSEYDAIIVDYNRLELMQERLMAAMAKASVGNVKPVNVTQTKPFKRNGVTNVAVLFEMDDGQTVTIVFHSPDATPAKLGPKDTLTSWKFMLNKRDVTAAVAPDNGENVQLPALAKRILLLTDKNSARFKRTNGKKAEQIQQLNDTNTRIEQKTATLNGLNDEIEALQKAVDAGVSAPAATPAQVQEEPVKPAQDQGQAGSTTAKPPIDPEDLSIALQDALVDVEEMDLDLAMDFDPVVQNKRVRREKKMSGFLIMQDTTDATDSDITEMEMVAGLDLSGSVIPFYGHKRTAGQAVNVTGADPESLRTALVGAASELVQKGKQAATQAVSEPEAADSSAGDKNAAMYLLANKGLIDKGGNLGQSAMGKVSQNIDATIRGLGILLAENEKQIEGVKSGKIKPSEIVGKGYGANTKSVALEWLNSQSSQIKSAMDYANGVKSPVENPAPAAANTTTPKKQAKFENAIKLVADGVEKVRKQDVQRLIESVEGNTRAKRNDARKALGDYIKSFRPDLAQEVDDVMFALQEDTELEYDDLAKLGTAEVVSQGRENIYMVKDGVKYYSKVMNTEDFPVGPFDFAKYPRGLPKEQRPAAAPAAPAAAPAPAANPDADFLNAVIAGTPPDMPPKEITAKLKSIYLAAKDAGNTELFALSDKAIRAYAAQTKAKAQAKLAEVQ